MQSNSVVLCFSQNGDLFTLTYKNWKEISALDCKNRARFLAEECVRTAAQPPKTTIVSIMIWQWHHLGAIPYPMFLSAIFWVVRVCRYLGL